MSDHEDGLLAIEVDADDYAETAAGDLPSVSRTYQSEADFQVQKESCSAKINYGNTYQDLIKAVPILDPGSEGLETDAELSNANSKTKLSKKDVQLLGYAVGELYYDKEYKKVVDLCERVKLFCDFDKKTAESVRRWTERCQERMA